MADGAGCSQASSINDLRVRTPLCAGSLPSCFPSPLQAEHHHQHHHQHHPSTQKRRGGGTHIRPSHRAGCSQASSINDLRARTRLGVGSLLRATCHHSLRLMVWIGFKVLYFGEHLYSELASCDKTPVQPTLWQHFPHLPQPHLLFMLPMALLTSLHCIHQLPAELQPLLHLLYSLQPSTV
ncbi:hypothetical protein DPEC_G00325300 [Dallia pectoralis]|uniref:Uncharacterized protein n=1 Tax=Dallia pectoralis TaxID=75939 RepID=A0ACC2FBF1_DALPE|nr:hypothetical protein DPEC_G00325300 [Dallia pectoralis]